MAAEVEVQSAEVGRSGGRLHLSPLTDSNNKNLLEISPLTQSRLISQEPSKPVPGPKPRLTPKPFTVDRNLTIKPILAPKPQPKPRPESTRPVGYKPDLPSTPKPQTQPSSVSKLKSGPTISTRPVSTSFRNPKLNAGQTPKPVAQPFKPAPPLVDEPSKPISPSAQPSNLTYSRSLKRPPSAEWSGSMKKEESDLESPTKVGTSITRAKSMGYLLQIGPNEEDKTRSDTTVPLRAQSRGIRPRPVSAIYPTSPTKAESPNTAFTRTERRPLSADLTSKFESAGLSLHRKTSAVKENKPENKREQVKPTTPLISNPDQSKENVLDGDSEDVRGSSIKSRINLLLDSSVSPVTPAPGQAPDNTPAQTQTSPEAEPPVGVKQLIKQLTVDQTTPNQSPVLRPAVKPRPLPLDLTKRFSPDPAVSPGDTRHDTGKPLEKRSDDSVRTPSDEKTFVDLKHSPHHSRTPVSEGPDLLLSPKESEAHTVRASVFENVVEKHSILMVDENKSDKKILDEPDEEGKLVTATYKEPVSPSGPVRIMHAFDPVPAAEGNTASSESVPSAQWEDKAMTLRSRHSDGTKTTPEKSSVEQISNTPRYLRVGALPKWNIDEDIDLETGMPKDKPSDFEIEDASAAAKRLKTQPTEEQAKPRVTYFALTGQMQETVAATSEAGESMAVSDPSAQWNSQGKVLSFRRNPSGVEGYIKAPEFNSLTEAQREKQKLLETEKQAELEFSRLKEKEVQREFERQHQKEKQDFQEKQRALEIHRQIEQERLKHLEFEKQRQLELKRQRQMEKERQKQQEIERQNELEWKKQAEADRQAEVERHKQSELEKQRQIELEKQRQFELKKQKQELERQKQLEMEKQKQIEIERQRQNEVERLRQIEQEKQRQIELENQRQLELKKQKQELERQKQLEMEKQKHLEAEKQRQIEIQRKKQLEAEKQYQIELERQRQQDLERQRQMEFERQRQVEIERQAQIELDRQRLELEKQQQIEAEKLKQKEIERQKQIELEKQRQIEFERQKLQDIERAKQAELEKERQRQLERERREIERQRQRSEEERRQKELDKERKLLEKQKERQRMQAEAEELERRQQAELQKQRERKHVLEMEKQRLREKMEKEQAEKLRQVAIEQEMLRMRELDKERERQKEMERERQRELELQQQRELEKQRQKQLDIERQEMEKQRLWQQEQERERQKKDELERMKELERKQLLEFEKQKHSEMQQIVEMEKRRLREEAERMRQVAKQQEAERQRLKDKQKKEELERIRLESAALRPKVVDLDSILRNDQPKGSTRGDPSTRWKEPSPKTEQSLRPGFLDIDSFTSQSQTSSTKDLFPAAGIQEVNQQPMLPQTSGGLHSPVLTMSPQDPWELRSVEMSVDNPEQPRKPLSKMTPEHLLQRQVERQSPHRRSLGLVVDPFHMGPLSGPETKTSPTAPLPSSISGTEKIWLPRDSPEDQSRSEGPSYRRTQGSQELNRIRSRSTSRRSAPSSSAIESSLSRMRSRSSHRDLARDGWVQQKQNDSTEDESKDSETPVHETDSQYGTWETGLRSEDSLTPATPSSDSNLSPSPKKPTSPQSLIDHTSHTESADGVQPPSPSSEPLPFPDVPVTLLDNSALRSRAQLGKKRAPRSRPSRVAKQSEVDGSASDDWIYKDSTEEKVENKKEDSDSEELPKISDAGPTAASSQPQRVALFPGMDQSALMAQLKKRGESDAQTDGPTPAPSQLSRSPKSPFLPRATRVLPPPGGKENGEEDSPQWLKELKSKKRLSQYETES